MRALGLLAALALPVGGAAEGLPALHDVTGAAAGDGLHVHAEPDAATPVLGTLAPGTAGVEVVATDATGRWGQVNAGEAAGWAALGRLVRRVGPEDGAFPAVAACFGTEPFWQLRLEGKAAIWSEPGREAAGRVVSRLSSIARPDRHGLVAELEGALLTGVIATRPCSDGMSDRAYGLAFDAVHSGAVLSGCCSLAPLR